ncbi:MAG: DEAD/DEAH box helicase, partial [Clostridia bacterium]|nr:DEAD/DEAH box helicase [Clostridia bacterium]
MDRGFFTYENLGGQFPKIEDDIRRGVPAAVFGVDGTVRNLIVSCSDRPYVYILPDSVEAAKACDAIKTLAGYEPVLLVAKDEVLTYKKAVSRDSVFRRIAAVDRILSGDARVVCDIEAALQLVPTFLPRIEIEVGAEYDFTSLPSTLTRMGYTREYEPESPGTFTVRGDVLDVYPVGAENPIKIDFFGDTTEKIREYDPETREKISELKKIAIIAASDTFFEESEIAEIDKYLKESVKKFTNVAAYERARQIIDGFSDEAASGTFSAASFFMPLVKNHGTLFDILPKDTAVFYGECRDIDDRMDALESEHAERYDMLLKGGEVLDFSRFQLISKEDFLDAAKPFYEMCMQQFATETRFFNPVDLIHFKSTPAPVYYGTDGDVCKDVSTWQGRGYRIVLFTDGDGRAEQLRERLSVSFIGAAVMPVRLDLLEGVTISSEKLSHGTILHESGLVLIGSGDLYLKTSAPQRRIQKRRGDFFVAPEIGDFVVHETHGIGRITGTRKLETGDGLKEYVGVQYAGSDMLYVPVDQMDSLSKYTGADNPQLSRLGGQEFEHTKQRVIKSLRKMTIDLKALYAERSTRRGFEFPENAVMMEEFESAFPYEETPDQLASVAEIKADMCSSKVMDRLLCGDVGYGKTEVALRAVYLCVLGGKQAALMCPSTVLSDQHFNVATERFSEFGVRVAKINRFVTKKQQEETLKDLKEGKIDFIIGTHRLLSSDVGFCDLGLLVLDEEQRFGVEHKEKIKKLRTGVDCLTLSATPIPRTLHMSLSGIRDISTINTAPSKRLPVQTYVVEESDALIRDACVRELSRDGQIFILYNRVETIATFTEKIKRLVPEGKVIYCHGRMEKDTL